MMQKCIIINDSDNIFTSNITYNLCSENLGLGCILTFFFLLEFIITEKNLKNEHHIIHPVLGLLQYDVYSVYILGRSFARICFLIMMLRRCCCKIFVYNNSLCVRVRFIKDVREAVTTCN